MPPFSEIVLKRKTSHLWRKALSRSGREQKTAVNCVTWKQFLSQYERFTDVLCAAAKNGCDEILEREYQAVRTLFRAEYFRVSERLRPYLVGNSVESWNFKPSSIAAGRSGFRRTDVFESIFKVRTLQEILDADTGDLINRVSLLSEAVYQCDRDWK